MARAGTILIIVFAGILGGSTAAAQELGVAVGYTSMPGRIGSSQSHHGLVVRIGVHPRVGSHVRLGLEGAVERLNEVYREGSDTCFLPGGSTGPCFFRSWERDVGWSVAGTVRVNVRRSVTTPYILAGAGFLRVRTHSRQDAEDGAGNPLPNFISRGTFSDDGLQGHLGAGVEYRAAGLPIGITGEVRAIWLLYNYSGGLFADWSPSLLVGVRWGG